MPSFKPLDRTKDRKHGWSVPTELLRASKDTVVPISIDEMGKLLAHYLFVFVKKRDRGYTFVALQSLCKEENAYLTPEGKSLYSAIPRHYLMYPFVLKIVEKDAERNVIVLFDHESGLYKKDPEEKDGDKRFFDDEGEPSESFSLIVKQLRHHQEMQKVTQSVVDALEAANLLVPFEIGTKGIDVACDSLKGLYMIDQNRLQNLEEKTVQDLYAKHAFSLVYAQLFSMSRVETLKYLYSVYRKKHIASDVDIVESFFDSDNETIDFDWSKL